MYLGIEIGGTKLQLGVGSAVGNAAAAQLVELQRCHVQPQRGAQGILEQIQTIASDLIQRHRVTRIGIGFGGPVRSGIVTKSHQVAGWENFPLADWCQQHFGLATLLGNDCDVAALAEATFGAGRAARTVFYVTVGTGVGGGLVIGGRLHGSGRPAVAEIGHLRPGLEAVDGADTVESRASGPGIVSTALRLANQLNARERSQLVVRLGPMDQWTAKQLAVAAAEGDAIAESAIEHATRVLGWAIAQVITIVAPEVVVVGGGVSLIGDSHFFAPLRQQVATYVFPPLRDSYQIVSAALGEEAVVHGAIALAATDQSDSPT